MKNEDEAPLVRMINISKRFGNVLPFFLKLLRVPEFGVIASTLVIAVAFTFIYTGFLSFHNIAGILTAASLVGIVSIGEAFLLISGEFDLSVGANFGACSIFLAYLIRDFPEYSFVALLATLGLGSLVGFANGLVTTRMRVPSFITTLGMLFFLRGMVLCFTRAYPIACPRVPLLFILNGPIGADFRVGIIWFVVTAIVFWIVLNKTRYGNWTYATGGNKAVAKAMGINPTRVKLQNFVLAGFCAALGGCVSVGRFRQAFYAAGEGMELEAVAAAVIGGCSLYGGYGSTIGAAVGAFMIMMIRVWLKLVGAPAFWYQPFIGIILVMASIINLWVFSR